jgi:hypothetical protein
VQFSGGSGGDINILSRSLAISDRGEVTARSDTSGAGGNISIVSDEIDIERGGGVLVDGANSGDAGRIALTANDMNIDGGRVTAKARLGDGGNIDIGVSGTLLLIDGEISTAVGTGSGMGGNLRLMTENMLVLERARISADAFGGDGGNIEIVTQALIADNESTITASSELGIDGTVTVHAPELETEDAIVGPEAGFVEATSLLSERCTAEGVSRASRLVVTRGDALPEQPDTFITATIGGDPSPSTKHSVGTEETSDLVRSLALLGCR